MMNSQSLIDDDCCLLWDVCLSAERVSARLARRFRSNSIRTSFDFKSFLPEQPSDNVKIARSLLKVRPLRINSLASDDGSATSDSAEDEPEPILSPRSILNEFDDDEYLERLVTFNWEKNETLVHSDDEDDTQQVDEENIQAHSLDLLPEIPTNEVEDVLITFTHRPVKTEPMIQEDHFCLPSQLDGQTDFDVKEQKNVKKLPRKSSESKTLKKRPTHAPADQLESMPSSSTSSKSTRPHSIDASRSRNTKKRKRLCKTHPTRTLLHYFPVIQHSSRTHDLQFSAKSSMSRIRKRSANYFDGCIVIDDDDEDVKEIKQQNYSLCKHIRSREKLLDYAIRSSPMRLQWLTNLEFVLLEHISICHQANLRPSNTFYSKPQIKYEPSDTFVTYSIDPSFISIIICNFLEMFVIGDTSFERKELLLYQNGFTSHLRYLLIELPTSNHSHHFDEMTCSHCDEYSSILNFLFDLIEFDLCEVSSRGKFRSSLIKDSDFQQMTIRKKNPFDRIKFVVYFIELIGLHRDKCPKTKECLFHANEDKVFQWMEQFIYQIANERMTMCFNVMELCLLFAKEKEQRVKQMALFLVKMYEENAGYLQVFLFDKNLFPDIRLLFVNELIYKKFNMKLISMDALDEFFQRIEITLRSADTHTIDDETLLLTRSLFNTYADLQLDIKHSRFSEQFTSMLGNQLEAIHLTLFTVRSNSSPSIERMEIFFRLLKCKWKKL